MLLEAVVVLEAAASKVRMKLLPGLCPAISLARVPSTALLPNVAAFYTPRDRWEGFKASAAL